MQNLHLISSSHFFWMLLMYTINCKGSSVERKTMCRLIRGSICASAGFSHALPNRLWSKWSHFKQVFEALRQKNEFSPAGSRINPTYLSCKVSVSSHLSFHFSLPAWSCSPYQIFQLPTTSHGKSWSWCSLLCTSALPSAQKGSVNGIKHNQCSFFCIYKVLFR